MEVEGRRLLDGDRAVTIHSGDGVTKGIADLDDREV
jgi:hypothetical protein